MRAPICQAIAFNFPPRRDVPDHPFPTPQPTAHSPPRTQTPRRKAKRTQSTHLAVDALVLHCDGVLPVVELHLVGRVDQLDRGRVGAQGQVGAQEREGGEEPHCFLVWSLWIDWERMGWDGGMLCCCCCLLLAVLVCGRDRRCNS